MNLSNQNKPVFTLLVFLLIFSNQIVAQNSDDLEGWSAVQLDVRASEKVSFSISEHLRYRNDITTVSTYFTQLEANYEVAKDFELGGGVRFIKKNDDVGKKQGIESHFRYQFDASFKHDINRMGLSYRLRYQNKNELGFSEDEGDIAKEQLRLMFGVDYKLLPVNIVFKLKTEFFNTFVNKTVGNKINRQRFTFSASRKFNKFGKISLFYRVQDDLHVKVKKTEVTVSKSILGFKYTYSLDFRKTDESLIEL
ncbi:DUF2490 domain-containing protein [Flavobacteriaceae bacterium]|nr:DUF2490 domain-containing protein [Flavobacteriaceae bacterium]